jgi:hypothetical protein
MLGFLTIPEGRPPTAEKRSTRPGLWSVNDCTAPDFLSLLLLG